MAAKIIKKDKLEENKHKDKFVVIFLIKTQGNVDKWNGSPERLSAWEHNSFRGDILRVGLCNICDGILRRRWGLLAIEGKEAIFWERECSDFVLHDSRTKMYPWQEDCALRPQIGERNFQRPHKFGVQTNRFWLCGKN